MTKLGEIIFIYSFITHAGTRIESLLQTILCQILWVSAGDAVV